MVDERTRSWTSTVQSCRRRACPRRGRRPFGPRESASPPRGRSSDRGTCTSGKGGQPSAHAGLNPLGPVGGPLPTHSLRPPAKNQNHEMSRTPPVTTEASAERFGNRGTGTRSSATGAPGGGGLKPGHRRTVHRVLVNGHDGREREQDDDKRGPEDGDEPDCVPEPQRCEQSRKLESVFLPRTAIGKWKTGHERTQVSVPSLAEVERSRRKHDFGVVGVPDRARDWDHVRSVCIQSRPKVRVSSRVGGRTSLSVTGGHDVPMAMAASAKMAFTAT